MRTLLLHACTEENSTFSYQRAWPRHIQADARFACTPVNVAGRGVEARLRREWAIHRFGGDVIVILHSVFSNAQLLGPRLVAALAALPQPKVFLIGNEYKLMPEKMAFCDAIGVSLLISQSHSPRVHELYRQRLGCAVTGISNTGLDPSLFRPEVPVERRPIDLGYRAADAPSYLGHQERREIAEYFVDRAAGLGLRVDVSMAAEDRLAEAEWAAFLNRCKGQLGTEAGGDTFDLEDRIRNAVIAYEAAHPDATFADLRERFFTGDTGAIPLRILSGRHVEAAGTGTVQILFEGDYDGLFVADEHYIPLRKDFGNVDDALRKFRDPATRDAIAGRALALVRDTMTYDRLIDKLHAAVRPLAA